MFLAVAASVAFSSIVSTGTKSFCRMTFRKVRMLLRARAGACHLLLQVDPLNDRSIYMSSCRGAQVTISITCRPTGCDSIVESFWFRALPSREHH